MSFVQNHHTDITRESRSLGFSEPEHYGPLGDRGVNATPMVPYVELGASGPVVGVKALTRARARVMCR